MRMLILTTRFHGAGGIERYGRLVVRALEDLAIEVDVLSVLAGETGDQPSSGSFHIEMGRRTTPWLGLRLLVEAVRRGRRYDLVLCVHVATAPIAALLRMVYGIPYLVVAHGIEVWGIPRWARRFALLRASRIVAVSRFTADRLIERQRVRPERVQIVRPCVDPELMVVAKLPITNGAVTLLTVARLNFQTRNKGCETVIQILPTIGRQAGPVRYCIVGEGDDRPRLEALAKHHGVADAVTFAGPVDRRGLAARYRACDIFVMPSVLERRADEWIAGEGFGIVYIEAAAFGLPVVAGCGGGAPEAVQDGVSGVVVDGAAPEAVTAALVWLARDGDLRGRMGAAGRRWVQEHFTFTRFRAEIADAVAAARATRPR
jgi:phosphatidyl-myo-inositol dimannoside synthase